MHCTASSQKLTLQQLRNEFKARGWKNPGYHYVVFPDGEIKCLLNEEEISNGVQGYNSTSINVAYVGGIDSKGKACDNRTDLQKAALVNLLVDLKRKYPNAHIMGHRDIWGKNPAHWKKYCPCFDAEEEYENIGKPIEPLYEPIDLNKPESLLTKIKKLLPWGKKQ